MIRGWIQIAAFSLGLAVSPGFLSAQMKDSAMAEPPRVTYHTAQVDGLKLFYREAGPKDAPTVVLLHGFPSSSHMFRELIPRLSDKYHVVAPDYPGFGYSDAPSPDQYAYTFDHLADTVDHFLDQKGITKYSIYVQDYGSPIGFRLATRHPNAFKRSSPRTAMLTTKACLPSGLSFCTRIGRIRTQRPRRKCVNYWRWTRRNCSTCKGSEIPMT